ncbi:MAG: nucleoside/nucleotide kinase family protein [Sciscionella sp.]
MTAFEHLLLRARALAVPGERRVLGICGPPASGKSTLAERMVRELGSRAVVVGMDGFHLAQSELARLGRTDRKGAPDTFDVVGYLALLARIRAAEPDTVYAPRFRRDIEEPIACAVPIPPDLPLVVTEGNYLLHDEPPWHRVRDLLDEVWFLAPEEDERLRRLIARHMAFGRTAVEARRRALGSDQRNADLITATAHRADLVVSRCWR